MEQGWFDFCLAALMPDFTVQEKKKKKRFLLVMRAILARLISEVLLPGIAGVPAKPDCPIRLITAGF